MFGDDNKPIWITEVGFFPTHKNGVETDGAFLPSVGL
jgi:hypothetical protein